MEEAFEDLEKLDKAELIGMLWAEQGVIKQLEHQLTNLKKEMQDYVKTHTAPYKYPRILEFVDELPKTISGKIKRTDIREAYDKAK